jgi:hypothetical protein
LTISSCLVTELTERPLRRKFPDFVIFTIH